MAAAKSAIKAAVFIRAIHVIAVVASARIVANPFAIPVDVRRFGMPPPVVKISVFLDWTPFVNACGTVSRNVLTSSTDFGAPAMLLPSAVLFMLGKG
jgi:hypothetical protein